MATLCKNCSHALVFDPVSQMMFCSSCGSEFKPEEVESEAKPYRQDLNLHPGSITQTKRSSWTATFIRAVSAAVRS